MINDINLDYSNTNFSLVIQYPFAAPDPTLRLAPNNKISGGKVLSNKMPKGCNRLKIALRNAANAIGNLKNTHLADFFKRVSYRRGRTAAVSATHENLLLSFGT